MASRRLGTSAMLLDLGRMKKKERKKQTDVNDDSKKTLRKKDLRTDQRPGEAKNVHTNQSQVKPYHKVS